MAGERLRIRTGPLRGLYGLFAGHVGDAHGYDEPAIFESRRLADDPITLAELADEFGVSRERVLLVVRDQQRPAARWLIYVAAHTRRLAKKSE